MQGARDFAGDDDLVFAQAALQGELGGFERGQYHALVDDFIGAVAQEAVGILLHLAHDQLLIEGAAVDADAHGLAVIAGDIADGGELFVAALAGSYIAGIDAVFIEGGGGARIFCKQNVPVVVEIADERRVASGVEHALLDLGDGGSRFGNVYGDAHHLRTCGGELEALLGGGRDVGGVGVGHRLDDDGRASADLDAANFYGVGGEAMGFQHGLGSNWVLGVFSERGGPPCVFCNDIIPW